MPSSPARAERAAVDAVMSARLSAIRRRAAPPAVGLLYPSARLRILRPTRAYGRAVFGTSLPAMDVPHGFDPTLILALNLAGTFVFGLSGGLAAVRARLDLFGIVVLSAVVGLAGGITRDLLIGTAPATFRDWRYLAAAAAAGLIC